MKNTSFSEENTCPLWRWSLSFFPTVLVSQVNDKATLSVLEQTVHEAGISLCFKHCHTHSSDYIACGNILLKSKTAFHLLSHDCCCLPPSLPVFLTSGYLCFNHLFHTSTTWAKDWPQWNDLLYAVCWIPQGYHLWSLIIVWKLWRWDSSRWLPTRMFCLLREGGFSPTSIPNTPLTHIYLQICFQNIITCSFTVGPRPTNYLNVYS